jgi:two-component system, sensor histidine kinase LadS
MFKKAAFISFIILIVCINNIYAVTTIKIDDKTKYYPLGLNLEILEDKDKIWSINDITSSEISKMFVKNNVITPSFGFTKSAYWVRFRIDSRVNNTKDWLIELAYPLMDKITFYVPDDDDNYVTKRSGYRTPFSQREIKHRNYIFKIELLSNDNKIYYMRFENEDRMEIPLYLYSMDEFQKVDHNDQFIFGLYYGIAIVMFLYNFLLFFYIKNRAYLFYVFFILAYSFFQLTQNGLAYEYLLPKFLEPYSHYIPFTLVVGLISIITFTVSFLNIRLKSLKQFKFFMALIIVLVVNFFTQLFIDYSLSIQILVILSIISFISVLTAGTIGVLQKYNPARYFMLAWTAFVIGAIMYALKVVAVLPSNYFTNYTMQIGSVIQLILLSLGLGDRISRMRKEKREAEINLVETQKREYDNMKKAKDEIEEANRIILLSEQKYKSIVESSGDIIFSLDENLNFITVNKAIKTHLKIDPEKVKSMNFLDFVCGDTDGKSSGEMAKLLVKEKFDEVIKTEKPIVFTTYLYPKYSLDPKEMEVKLEYINIEGKNEILGKASSIIEDSLLKSFISEKQLYSIKNYFASADDISYRATRNLRMYMDVKDINYLRVSLREIIINAIEHGNLNITFEEKSEATTNGTYSELVTKRQRDPKNFNKRVEVEYLINNSKAVYKISDNGGGFDYNKILNANPEELNDNFILHGRGLIIAKNAFDEIQFNKKGNQVLLVKHLSKR